MFVTDNAFGIIQRLAKMKDRNCIATFLLIGAVIETFWTCFLFNVHHFNMMYRSAGILLPFIYLGFWLGGTLFMLFFGKHLPVHYRVIVSQVGLLLSLVFAGFMPFGNFGYTSIIVLFSLSSVCRAILQSSVYGVAAVFGSSFLHALLVGQSCGFLGLLIVKSCTSLSVFGPSMCLVVMAMWRYIKMTGNEYAIAKLEEYEYLQHRRLSTVIQANREQNEFSSLLNRTHSIVDMHEEHLNVFPTVRSVFDKTKVYFLTICVSYAIGLSFICGFVERIPSITFHERDTFLHAAIVIFSGSDALGKMMANTREGLTIKCIYRPIIMQLCCTAALLGSVFYPISDYCTLILIGLLAAITGYIVATAILIASSLCIEAEKEIYGILCTLGTVVGLLAGSFVAYQVITTKALLAHV